MILIFNPRRYNDILLKNKPDPCKRRAKILILEYINLNNNKITMNYKENEPIYIYDIKKIISVIYGLNDKFIDVLDEINYVQNNTIRNLPVCNIKKGSGFFSCCSVILHHIIGYYNKYKITPFKINCQNQYGNYCIKKYNGNDIINLFFLNYNTTEPIVFTKSVSYFHCYQYYDYKKINIDTIIPFVKKFFTPSKIIYKIHNELLKKYNIVLENNNYCGVYYRGTDKYKETKIMTPKEYIDKMLLIQKNNKNIIFIIQTDSAIFIDYIKKIKELNCIYFDENKTSNTNVGIHHTLSKEENFNQIKICLAIFLIISKCKYIIFGTGNCSIWISFFRDNTRNIFQSHNGKWIT